MFDQSNIFNAVLIIPILNVLMAVYHLFLAIKVPGALGFSLILLTVIIRLILHPLTIKQLKSTQKLAHIKPKLDELNKLHKEDKTRLQQEQLKLYQEAGINPASGCLPLLLQMPILIGLYNLFFNILGHGNDLTKVVDGINKVVYFPFLKIESLDLSFFGLSLTSKPNEWQQIGWGFLLIPLVTAGLQYIQTKMMTQTQPVSGIVKKEGEKKGEEDMSMMMQKQMSIMMPLMIGFFAYSFPLGLSLYWNTYSIFGILQQQILNKELEKEKNHVK